MLSDISCAKILSFKIFTNCCLLLCAIDFDLFFIASMQLYVMVKLQMEMLRYQEDGLYLL